MLYIVKMVAVLHFISLDSLAYCFGFNVSSTFPTPTFKPTFFSFRIWILCQNSLTRELKIRVVGFVLKKLITHSEMLIVSHALLTICYTVLVSVFDNHVSVEQLMSKET